MSEVHLPYNIVNIRGTSGSGKSTLVKRYLDEHPHEAIEMQLGDWKKPKIVAYQCNPYNFTEIGESLTGKLHLPETHPVFVIGRYETQCGGCDAMSYKGSHEDIEAMVRHFGGLGDVIFEGLTISSTITRWQRVATDYKNVGGTYWWAFMSTEEEECHQRIVGRSGREPKRKGPNQIADYQIKFRACRGHLNRLKEAGENVLELTSDNAGYQQLSSILSRVTWGPTVATA